MRGLSTLKNIVAPLLFAFLASGTLGSCSGSRATPRRPQSSLLTQETTAPAYASPAVWRYHPPEQARVNAQRELSDGKILYAGKRGERWLFDPKTRTLEAGAVLAPEDLIAIVQLPEGGYWFVGESGTSYEATEPLGPFVRSSAPLERLVKASATRRTIVGITSERTLVQSKDASASFAKVGPPGTTFVDVALRDDGKGLALALPEQLFRTDDEGATWTPLNVKTFGVFSLEKHIQHGIIAWAALGPMRFAPDGATAVVPLKEDPTAPLKGPALAPPRGPDAGALAEGRAVIVGRHYAEVARVEEGAHSWLWVFGNLDGKLEERPLEAAKGCRNVRLAAFDDVLELACFRSSVDASAQGVTFVRSENAGKSWHKETFSAEANLGTFKMAAGGRGALLLTGICPALRPGTTCNTGGVYMRREAKKLASRPGSTKRDDVNKPFELTPSATPALADSALSLAFSADGRVAYAIGRRTKGGSHAVFVSRDGGSTFEAEELRFGGDAERDETQEFWERTSVPSGIVSMVAAEDGTLAIVFGRREGQRLIVVDENGKLMSIADPPDERAMLAAAGMRALAVSPSSREVWESLDAGATWNSVGRFPVELCTQDENCEVPVRCAPLGCIIGDEVSRIGWSGQVDDDSNLLPPPERQAAEVVESKLRVPISCTLEEAPWKPLPGVSAPPTAFESALGKAAWFAQSFDDSRASVSAFHAYGGANPRVQSVSVLPAVPRPENYALISIEQVEGLAALRYPIAEARGGDPRLRNVEVAWDNLLEGRTVRARIPDAGDFSPGDYKRGPGRTQKAEPDLLSIGEGGIYVRIHHAAGERQDTLFLDGKGISVVPEITWPAFRVKGARSEMAHVDSTHVPLQIIGRGVAVTRARRENETWVFDAITTGLADPSAFGLMQSSNIAYVGKTAGLYIETRAATGADAEAMVLPFRAKGDVVGKKVPVPTQLDLGERPERCAANVRETTPRIVAQAHAGTRHPVIVSDSADAPHLLITSNAVLHGTPAEPCVASFDAESVPSEAAQARLERAIILPDDLEHAWLFRAAPETTTNPEVIEYRNMNCRFDANAEVPPELFRTAPNGPRSR